MSTTPETIDYILSCLGSNRRFTTRRMFGEYALYADGKVVGLVCNDQLYVKIIPASQVLEALCEKDEAYPGSKLYYLVEENQLTTITELPEILLKMAKTLLPPKSKTKKLTTPQNRRLGDSTIARKHRPLD